MTKDALSNSTHSAKAQGERIDFCFGDLPATQADQWREEMPDPLHTRSVMFAPLLRGKMWPAAAVIPAPIAYI